MRWYCEKCKKIHSDDELCPRYRKQLEQNPDLLAGIIDFSTVAGEEYLITSQSLDVVANGINHLVGTNLSYEGTQQFARDIQVFKRLNEEAFSKAGVFSNPNAAKSYLESATKGQLDSLNLKLTGSAQEVDWLRMKQGELSSLFEKSTLLEKNAPGVDGITVNRFTGKTISRTTVKASVKPMSSNSTAVRGVKKAIEKGTATSDDIFFGPKGTEAAARKAGLTNPVIEKNTAEQIEKSNERLKDKIINNQATTGATLEQVSNKMTQGAVVGAAISITVSSITNYMQYRNGEISREEAFVNISEETVKGALVGGAMGAVTIFLPVGAIGFVAGFAIGVYFNKTCTNILDEVYGKGAYGAILDSSGYVYGMTFNLAEYYKKINDNLKQTETNVGKTRQEQSSAEDNLAAFEAMKGD